MAKNEVAVVENYNLVTLTGEIAEAIAEEMDGLGTIPFDRVKIPSGGGLAFEVPGEDDENPDAEKELTGIILYHHPINSYWKDKFEGGNEAPDCSSNDGKKGCWRETGEIRDCASCEYNQFAEDGSGKACKNIHRIYFLREGNPVPLIISLPPTSLKYMRDYIGKRILLKGMRCYDAITKISLKKEKSNGGIDYSRAVFTYAGKIEDAAKKEAIAAMVATVKKMDSTVQIEDADYNTPAAATDESGFMNVPEQGQEALPFEE